MAVVNSQLRFELGTCWISALMPPRTTRSASVMAPLSFGGTTEALRTHHGDIMDRLRSLGGISSNDLDLTEATVPEEPKDEEGFTRSNRRDPLHAQSRHG